ncbi:MAG: hypothetical protein IJC18_00725 [Clostridia bacterium]|nr:hypothetical protein [Clostridia bacterium]MBQ9993817.1 hypothetical protein [Clostridia bacterium]
MNCLFGGNSCTWVLILVIVFLISQNCCGEGYDYDDCGRSSRCNNCGCGCN